jgi:hypothetical protein
MLGWFVCHEPRHVAKDPFAKTHERFALVYQVYVGKKMIPGSEHVRAGGSERDHLISLLNGIVFSVKFK